MRCCAYGLAGLLAATAAGAAERPRFPANAIEAQHAMDGTWTGDGTTIVVDATRLQVNMDPDRPFEWRTFRIVDITGKMVVFDVGTMRYVALFTTPSALTLTSPAFTGERSLRLVPR